MDEWFDSHLPNLLIQLVAMHGGHELLDGQSRLASPGANVGPVADQRLQDLCFSPGLAPELGVDLGGQIGDDDAVGRVADLAVVRLHDAKGIHPCAQLLHGGGTVAQDVVPSEHYIFLFEDETHMVVRVAGCVDGLKCSALDHEDLSVDDWVLGFAGRVLVDGRREAWV